MSAPPLSVSEAMLPGASAPVFGETDFLSLIQILLPRGRAWAWKDDPESVGYGLLGGIALSETQAHQVYLELLADSPIGTLLQMVPEWEKTLGLPDPCVGPDPSFELRVRHIMARLQNKGGQSIPYLIAYALALGFVITTTEFTPARFGSRFGGRFYGDAWAYTLQISAALNTIVYARFGLNRFGDRFANWGNAVLECELRRVAGGHLYLIFSYS